MSKRITVSMMTIAVVLVSASSLFAEWVVLDVPQKYQEQTQWCWNGVSQSVLAYYGIDVSQPEIAQYATDGQNIPNYLNRISWAPPYYGVVQILDNFRGVDSSTTLTSLDRTSVSNSISTGRPLIIRWNWDEGNGGHVVVIKGFDAAAGFVDIMDPWSGPTEADYDWVRHGSGHTWDETLYVESFPYVLTTTGPNGTIAVTPSTTNGIYPSSPSGHHVTLLTLTATADAGYVFSNWKGDLSGSSNPDMLLLISDNPADALGRHKTVTAVFTPINPSPRLTITTDALPPITAGQPYAARLEAAGGTPPYRWGVEPIGGPPYGSFPAPVSFAEDGTIVSEAATRLSAGLYTFLVHVTDDAAATVSASYGLAVSCGDADRDSLTAQYVTYQVVDVTGQSPEPPVCQDFTQTARSARFSFGELTANSGSGWALIRLPLTIGSDAWAGWYAAGFRRPREISSGFRAPAQSAIVPGTVATSRHLWGDAVDFINHTRTLAEFDAMFAAAQNAGASYLERRAAICTAPGGCDANGVPTHAHADWRGEPGLYQHGAGDR